MAERETGNRNGAFVQPCSLPCRTSKGSGCLSSISLYLAEALTMIIAISVFLMASVMYEYFVSCKVNFEAFVPFSLFYGASPYWFLSACNLAALHFIPPLCLMRGCNSLYPFSRYNFFQQLNNNQGT